MFLHVGFGRASAMQPGIEVDKSQILPLRRREGFVEGLTPAIRFRCSCLPRTWRLAMNVRYGVELSQIERTEPRALLSGCKHASRKLKRAQILLDADVGTSEEEIARSVGVSVSTVYRAA